MSRVDVNADEVRRVRAALKLTQVQFAARLGVNVRTVIRGEQRGIELGHFGWTLGSNPKRDAWTLMLAEADKRDTSARIPKKRSRDTSIEVSRDRRRRARSSG